jgi:hypothetical protein
MSLASHPLQSVPTVTHTPNAAHSPARTDKDLHPADHAVCDLLVRSYWKDLEWLGYCLASIRRYCRGFRQTIVVVPKSSVPWLRRSGLQDGAEERGIRFVFCRDYPDDYLGQQVTKLLADMFTDAAYICHVDSDCVFQRPITPGDLIEHGRPMVFTRAGRELGRHDPWRKPTERFLGWPVGKDFMQRPPFLYPRWLYEELRDHAMATHGVDVETYIKAQPVRGFSEYNTLGAFAWHRHRTRFAWIDITDAMATEPFCRWYWSWGGIDDAIRTEIEGILCAAEKEGSR